MRLPVAGGLFAFTASDSGAAAKDADKGEDVTGAFHKAPAAEYLDALAETVGTPLTNDLCANKAKTFEKVEGLKGELGKVVAGANPEKVRGLVPVTVL